MDLSILFKVLCCCILVKADECVQRSPCGCVFPNGTGINLEQSATTHVFMSSEMFAYDLTSNINKYTYFFHPCYDVLMHKPQEEIDSCLGKWSICRHYEQLVPEDSLTYTMNRGYDAVGTVSHSHFASDALGTYIHYSWPLSTKVYLSCDEGEDKLHIKRWDTEVELVFFSRNACLQRLEKPASELSMPRWIGMQWIKLSQAVKEGYANVVDGLKWLVPQPLEIMPSFMGRM